MIYIYDELSKITNDDYKKICNRNNYYISNHRKYHNYLDSVKHELGIYLIYLYLKNVQELDLLSTFKYYFNGKPTITKYNISISKCDNGVIMGIDKELIGVDIDTYQNNLVLQKNIFLSENEISTIKSGIDYNFYINCKEAYLKCKGIGINEDVYNLDFSKYLNRNVFIYDNLNFKYKRRKNYSYIICSKNRNIVKRITYNELRRSLYELEK